MKIVLPVSLVCLALAGCSPSGETATATDTQGSTTQSPTTGTLEPTTGATATEPPTTGSTTSDMPDPTTGLGTEETGVTDSTGEATTSEQTTDTGPVPLDCDEVVIVDPILESEVRNALKLPDGPISGEEALALEHFFAASAEPVQTLEGLQCFANLGFLYIALSDPSRETGTLRRGTMRWLDPSCCRCPSCRWSVAVAVGLARVSEAELTQPVDPSP